MGTFFAIAGVLGIICLAIKALCEKELPADYHNNWRLESQDADKVRFGEMSKSEFIKNMNNGKYR